jgi:hypothetical protein
MDMKKARKRVIANRHRRKLKETLVSHKGGKCEICGYDKSMRALQFHHTDPNQKDFGIGRRTVSDLDKILKEIDKCRLLCSNCHLEEHEQLDQIKQQELENFVDIPTRDGKWTCLKCGERFIPVGKERRCKSCLTPVTTKVQKQVSRKRVNWPEDNLLQAMVLEKPLIHVAVDIGISDNAVRKRCLKLDIPLPERGFWLKKSS